MYSSLVSVGKKIEFTRNSLPFTAMDVMVIDPVSNSESEETFEITMTGGTIENTSISVTNEPVPEEGDEFLVFCKKNEDGTYRILSGSQGLLAYQDGKISTLNVVNEKTKRSNSGGNITIEHQSYEDVKRVVLASLKE